MPHGRVSRLRALGTCWHDLAWRLYQTALRAERAAAAERSSWADQRNGELAAAVESEFQGRLTRWLRIRLARWPWWGRGHLELGRISLARSDIATAYASARAAGELLHSTSGAFEARVLEARACLARGAHDRARPLLLELCRLRPDDVALAEDLAACSMAAGDWSGACEILERIPEERRSGEGIAALAWARRQISEEMQ